MPHKLPVTVTDRDRARRHVLSQQIYRLRKRYRLMASMDMSVGAEVLAQKIHTLEAEYDNLGGRPYHVGNVL